MAVPGGARTEACPVNCGGFEIGDAKRRPGLDDPKPMKDPPKNAASPMGEADADPGEDVPNPAQSTFAV